MRRVLIVVRTTLTAVLLPAVLLTGVPGAAAASPAASPAARSAESPAASRAARCGTPFTASFAASLARDFPGQRVTASVYDTRTGCWYDLHPGMRITTASVIKAAVMGAVLLRAQDRGRGLTGWERDRIRPMITYSYNNPYVSDLLYRVGGVAGMDRFDRRMGARSTRNSLAYGATSTTARDRTRIALGLLHPGGPLRAAGRAEAWRYLTRVTPTQRWGITAGVPAGWDVALKNGFYPMRGNGWRVGSTGFVRRAGGAEGYAVTILTDRNGSQVAGMRLVERVSRRVAATLAGGPAAARVVDRSRCTTTRAGQTWPQVARRVGLPSARWRDVRRVSGGNAGPLSGQRACSPVLRRP
jgi:beta-lactamase class A